MNLSGLRNIDCNGDVSILFLVSLTEGNGGVEVYMKHERVVAETPDAKNEVIYDVKDEAGRTDDIGETSTCEEVKKDVNEEVILDDDAEIVSKAVW